MSSTVSLLKPFEATRLLKTKHLIRMICLALAWMNFPNVFNVDPKLVNSTNAKPGYLIADARDGY